MAHGKSKFIQLCLRFFQLGSGSIVTGIIGHEVRQFRRAGASVSGRLVYTLVIAALSVLAAIVLMPPFKHTFFSFPLDFLLFIAFIVAFGLLANLTVSGTCSSSWYRNSWGYYWGGWWNVPRSTPAMWGSRGCSYWRTALAFLFIAGFLWFMSSLVGLYGTNKLLGKRTTKGYTRDPSSPRTHQKSWFGKKTPVAPVVGATAANPSNIEKANPPYPVNNSMPDQPRGSVEPLHQPNSGYTKAAHSPSQPKLSESSYASSDSGPSRLPNVKRSPDDTYGKNLHGPEAPSVNVPQSSSHQPHLHSQAKNSLNGPAMHPTNLDNPVNKNSHPISNDPTTGAGLHKPVKSSAPYPSANDPVYPSSTDRYPTSNSGAYPTTGAYPTGEYPPTTGTSYPTTGAYPTSGEYPPAGAYPVNNEYPPTGDIPITTAPNGMNGYRN